MDQDPSIKDGLDRNLRLADSLRQAYFEFDGHVANVLILVSSIFIATLDNTDELYKLVFFLLASSVAASATAIFILRNGIGNAQKKLLTFFDSHNDLEKRLKNSEITEVEYYTELINNATSKDLMDIISTRRKQFEFLVKASAVLTGFSIALVTALKLF